MTFEITAHPDFSWSISRQRALDQCPRAYFCSYYLSHNGWMDEAAPDAQMAYRLKQLCTLDTELGHQIDVRARELEACVRAGQPLPSFGELEARTRASLNACWISSKRDRDDFEWSPKRVTMLRCLYLGQDSQAEVARVEEKLHAAHEAILAVSHWDRLRECGEEGRIEIPGFAHFVLADGLKVFAAPDLAYVHDDEVHVIDWKTGREDESQELQVKLQAWWLLETYPKLAGLELRGYLEYLTLREEAEDTGAPASSTDGTPGSSTAGTPGSSTAGVTHAVPLDGDFKAEAAQAVRDGVAQMRRLLADPDKNAPLPIEAFERREGPLCGGCNFSPLCRS
jgi:hypothetical protein